MNWRTFRELTKDIPDEEEMYCDLYHPQTGLRHLHVNEEETRANLTNDNTIIFTLS